MPKDRKEAQIVVTALNKTDKAFREISSQFRKLEKQTLSIGRNLSLGLTAPIVTGLGAATKSAFDFDKVMLDVNKNVKGLDSSNIKEFERTVLNVGANSLLGAQGVAQLASEGGKLGLATEEALKFAKTAEQIAVAFDFGTSLGAAEEAGRVIGKLRTSFGITTDEVGDLADAINFYADNTASNARNITDIIVRTGSVVANSTGLQRKEIAALAATFDATAPSAEIASTGLKNFTLALTAGESATDKQAKAFRRLGFDSLELAKRMQDDAGGAIVAVLESLADLDDASRGATISQIFGKESIGAIAPLIGNIQAVKDNLEAINDVSLEGSALREFERINEADSTQLTLALKALQTAGITIGQVLLPPLAEIATRVSAIALAVSQLGDGLQTTIVTVAGIALAIGPALIATSSLIGAYRNVRLAILAANVATLTFRRNLAINTVLFTTQTGVGRALAATYLALGKAAKFAATQILLPAVAIGSAFAAIGSIIVALTGNADKLNDAFVRGLTVGQRFELVWGQALASVGIAIKAVAVGILEIPLAILRLETIIRQALENVRVAFSQLANEAISAFNEIVTAVASIINNTVSATVSGMNAILNAFVRSFEGAVNKVLPAVNKLRSLVGKENLESFSLGEIAITAPTIDIQSGIQKELDVALRDVGASSAQKYLEGLQGGIADEIIDVSNNFPSAEDFTTPDFSGVDAEPLSQAEEKTKMLEKVLKKTNETGEKLGETLKGAGRGVTSALGAVALLASPITANGEAFEAQNLFTPASLEGQADTRGGVQGIFGQENDAVLEEQKLAEKLELERSYLDQRLALLAEKGLEETELYENLEKQKENLVRASASVQLNAVSAGLGGMLALTKSFAGEQSGVYQALFAVSKGFAIADSIIKIQQGIANALSLPFPANIAAAGVVAGQAASIISTIKGTNPSFEGGGDTGAGARTGGVDGKGGFNAILHPRETVIDRTKPNQGMGDNVSVSINIDGDATDRTVERLESQVTQRVINAISESRRRGGQRSTF